MQKMQRYHLKRNAAEETDLQQITAGKKTKQQTRLTLFKHENPTNNDRHHRKRIKQADKPGAVHLAYPLAFSLAPLPCNRQAFDAGFVLCTVDCAVNCGSLFLEPAH